MLLPGAVATLARRRALLALPVVAYAAYVDCGQPSIRVAFLYEVRPNVRGAAGHRGAG